LVTGPQIVHWALSRRTTADWAITPRHSWPIFGNAAGELNSAQRTTPSLLHAPLTVIDNLPAGCDRPAVCPDATIGDATMNAATRRLCAECRQGNPLRKTLSSEVISAIAAAVASRPKN